MRFHVLLAGGRAGLLLAFIIPVCHAHGTFFVTASGDKAWRGMAWHVPRVAAMLEGHLSVWAFGLGMGSRWASRQVGRKFTWVIQACK